MAKRQIRDDHGGTWDVWDVIPGNLTGGSPYDRRAEPRPGGPADRHGLMLDPELEQGWLCFQKGIERRRYAPIPIEWIELPDTVLRVMLDIATPVVALGSSARPSNRD